MKKLYILCLAVILANMVLAQQTVTINAPAAIAGKITSFAAADFGTLTPGQTVTGNVVIGFDSTSTDSTTQLIGCSKISNNVTGKIVLIRRGTCNFSTKTLNAQAAGAIGILVYVRSGETPFQTSNADGTAGQGIKIPFAMIYYADAQKMVQAIKAGTVTTVTFGSPSISNPSTTLNYVSPIKETVQLFLAVAQSNPSASNLLKVKLKVDIKSPSGLITSDSATIDTIAASATKSTGFSHAYYPKEKGTYSVVYTNGLNKDSLFDKFIISDYVYAQDNLVPDNALSVDSATFTNSGLVFDVGHFFYTGDSATTVTHLGFAIHNWADIPKKDTFGLQLVLWPDDYFNSFGTISYNDIKGTSKALQAYKITGLEKNDSMVYVELKTPVKLVNDTTYAVIARYDGSGSANVKPPFYTTAGSNPETRLYKDLIWTYSSTTQSNRFYSGWNTNQKHTVRAYTTGFKPLVSGINELPAWEENQVTVFPNPISNNILSLQFDLAQNNPVVDLYITDQLGRFISKSKLTNVQKGVQQINIGDLANGTYFVTVSGTDGWRTKLFQLVK